MERDFPPGLADLHSPWLRAELLAYLEELATPDPRIIWRAEVKRGLISGVDQVIHFFFDDHDFDESQIGFSLLDKAEAALIQAIKRALGQLIEKLPHGGDDEYATDPLWQAVTASAVTAYEVISARSA